MPTAKISAIIPIYHLSGVLLMGYVCVIGGANIDIIGTPKAKLKTFDSNPGHMKITYGGVARNITENLRRLGHNVVFITAFGGDSFADGLKRSLEALGIDISHSLTLDDERSSVYMCLNDISNDMFIGLSDMDVLDRLTPQYLSEKLDVINNATCVVADTNIPNCLGYLQENVTVPLFIDTVSAKKTELIVDKLHNIKALKPNVYEAEILSGIKIEGEDDIKRAAAVIHEKGVEEVFITLGDKGAYYSSGSVFGKEPAFKSTPVSTTGAGDSFLAGLIASYCEGLSLPERVRFASAVASITVSDAKTVSDKVTRKNVEKILKGECL